MSHHKKAKTGSFCREHPTVISATSESQDSTDDHLRYDIQHSISPDSPEDRFSSHVTPPQSHRADHTHDDQPSDVINGQSETKENSKLPGLILYDLPERRKAVGPATPRT